VENTTTVGCKARKTNNKQKLKLNAIKKHGFLSKYIDDLKMLAADAHLAGGQSWQRQPVLNRRNSLTVLAGTQIPLVLSQRRP
jgi:hypothetical protein